MSEADKQTLSLLIRDFNKLFSKALKALAETGEGDKACQFAGEGWSLLRHEEPEEAERLNALLHYLTAPSKKHFFEKKKSAEAGD